MNFQFYDPIIQIIWMNMSSEKQQYFSLKTQFSIDMTMKESWNLWVKKYLGSDKMTQEDPIRNDKGTKELDHTKSQHSKSL